MRKQLGFTLVEIIVAVIAIAGGAGWIWNIVKLAGDAVWPPTAMVVLRVIGIFVAPLGAVLGFL